MWKLFSKKLQKILPRYDHEILNPLPEDIEFFEKKFCFVFPAAYKQFISEIGIGEFNQELWIVGPTRDNKIHDLIRWTKRTNANQTLVDIYGDQDLINAVIPFGNTIDGDIVGWDRRNKLGKEYMIVELPRHARRPRAIKLPFKAYLEAECLRSDKRLGKGNALEKGKQFEYRPFTKRRR